jgi:hypothetical protein
MRTRTSRCHPLRGKQWEKYIVGTGSRQSQRQEGQVAERKGVFDAPHYK